MTDSVLDPDIQQQIDSDVVLILKGSRPSDAFGRYAAQEIYAEPIYRSFLHNTMTVMGNDRGPAIIAMSILSAIYPFPAYKTGYDSIAQP